MCVYISVTCVYICMQLYGSFYVYQVAKNLKEAEKILIAMGYSPDTSAGHQEFQELKYNGAVNLDLVAKTAADIVVLQCDLDLLIGNARAIANDHNQVTLTDILMARNTPGQCYPDTFDEAIRIATQKQRMYNAARQWPQYENPQPYTQGTKLPPNLSSRETGSGPEYLSPHHKRLIDNGALAHRGSAPHHMQEYTRYSEGDHLTVPVHDNLTRRGSAPHNIQEYTRYSEGDHLTVPVHDNLTRRGSAPHNIQEYTRPENTSSRLADPSYSGGTQYGVPNTHDNLAHRGSDPHDYTKPENTSSNPSYSGGAQCGVPYGESNLQIRPSRLAPANLAHQEGTSVNKLTGHPSSTTEQSISSPEYRTRRSIFSIGSPSDTDESLMASLPRPDIDDLPDPIYEDEAAFTAEKDRYNYAQVVNQSYDCKDLYINPSSNNDYDSMIGLERDVQTLSMESRERYVPTLNEINENKSDEMNKKYSGSFKGKSDSSRSDGTSGAGTSGAGSLNVIVAQQNVGNISQSHYQLGQPEPGYQTGEATGEKEKCKTSPLSSIEEKNEKKGPRSSFGSKEGKGQTSREGEGAGRTTKYISHAGEGGFEVITAIHESASESNLDESKQSLWICDYCTNINPSEITVCDVCGVSNNAHHSKYHA